MPVMPRGTGSGPGGERGHRAGTSHGQRGFSLSAGAATLSHWLPSGAASAFSYPDESQTMPQCVTCGAELHPERAQKYSYCMARECQEKNAQGLTMVGVGVNKAAEQYMILDDQTRAELAGGKYHDQRRGSFGPSARPAPSQNAPSQTASSPAGGAGTAHRPVRRPCSPAPAAPARPRATAGPRPWTKSQEKLALLYNQQRLRPEEIASKLGLSTYQVTQIILAARNQGKALRAVPSARSA